VLESTLLLDFEGRRFRGISPWLRFEVDSAGWRICGGSERTGTGSPWEALRELLRSASERWPEGAAIGYFAYEAAHHMEPRAFSRNRAPEVPHPLVRLDFFEHLEEVPSPIPSFAPPVLISVPDDPAMGDFYRNGVETIKEYIAQGDIYQANLTWRFRTPARYAPIDLYERLRSLGHAPHAALLEWPDFAVISNSPESFLQLRNGVLTASPIKGTIRRGNTEAEDRQLAETLRVSIKDRAENVMIVDLLRNDLGRVCEFGSVSVPELFQVQSFPTLHHLVSTVQGRLKPGCDALDAFLPAFPCGSITGAPKIRAMQILSELEPIPRGIAMGAIGYFAFAGNMQWNVAIRTATHIGEELFFHAGGGIVADSVPEAEYNEMRLKARALWSANAA
jgi:para-aminobenzoate synthetase component 1